MPQMKREEAVSLLAMELGKILTYFFSKGVAFSFSAVVEAGRCEGSRNRNQWQP
jgi:hypothetical protein